MGTRRRVYVEIDWLDGPTIGIADLHGEPHYFSRLPAGTGTVPTLEFHQVWPVAEESLRMEMEQWEILVGWYRLYDDGKTTFDTHPGSGGRDRRYAQLERELFGSRRAPDVTGRAAARWVPLARAYRYELSGPDYQVEWSRIDLA